MDCPRISGIPARITAAGRAAQERPQVEIESAIRGICWAVLASLALLFLAYVRLEPGDPVALPFPNS